MPRGASIHYGLCLFFLLSAIYGYCWNWWHSIADWFHFVSNYIILQLTLWYHLIFKPIELFTFFEKSPFLNHSLKKIFLRQNWPHHKNEL